MSSDNSNPHPKWVEEIGAFLKAASQITEELLNSLGTRLPAINANMGLVIFRLIDTLANPIVMGYVASKTAPDDFRTTATILAFFIGISWSYLNWSISKDLVNRAPWTKQMGLGIIVVAGILIVSVLLDGIVDSSWVLILGGKMDILMSPGIKAYMIGIMSLPFILQVLWIMTFIASNVADIWAAIKEKKESDSEGAKSKDKDEHNKPEDKHGDDLDEPAKEGPKGKTQPPAEAILSLTKIQADSRKMAPVWDTKYSPEYFKLAEADQKGDLMHPVKTLGFVKGSDVPEKFRPKAPVSAPPPPPPDDH